MSILRKQFSLKFLIGFHFSIGLIILLNAIPYTSEEISGITGVQKEKCYGFPTPYYISGTIRGESVSYVNPFGLAFDIAFNSLLIFTVFRTLKILFPVKQD